MAFHNEQQQHHLSLCNNNMFAYICTNLEIHKFANFSVNLSSRFYLPPYYPYLPPLLSHPWSLPPQTLPPKPHVDPQSFLTIMDMLNALDAGPCSLMVLTRTIMKSMNVTLQLLDIPNPKSLSNL
jgi:hypothetical protein